MGKGDKKSRRGKISKGSYGVRRPRKKVKPALVKVEAKKPKATPKKSTAKKTTAKKTAAKPKAATKTKKEDA